MGWTNTTEYENWIREMTNWYEEISTWEEMSAKYHYFIEKFIEIKPEYNYPIDYSIKPNAMLNLMTVCNGKILLIFFIISLVFECKSQDSYVQLIGGYDSLYKAIRHETVLPNSCKQSGKGLYRF